jgi:hypothetical protein
MMRIAEQSGGKRARLMRFAGLGAMTGAVAAAVGIGAGFHWLTLYVVPGLVFGLAFATLLDRQRLMRRGRAALYVAAAVLGNAAAVYTAMQVLETVDTVVRGGIVGLAVSGGIAGAVGGGLLAAAAVPPLRLAHWPLLATAGASLGALLPLLVEGQEAGTVAFYVIWQAGYAAALAVLLPRTEAI